VTVSVNRRVLPAWVDPALVHAQLATVVDDLIWLDAGPQATEGFSYLAAGAGELLAAENLESLRAVIPAPAGRVQGQEQGLAGPFSLGYVGWLGYGLGAGTTGVDVPAGEHPSLCLAEVRAALEFDHTSRTVSLVTSDVSHDGTLVKAYTAATLVEPVVSPELSRPAKPAYRHGDEQYQRMVEACRAAISRGDAYQLCLTNEIRVDGHWDALAVYSRLRHDNPSHHGALLRLGGVHLLSSSPEVFMRLTPKGRLSTMPIKGTRPRGATAAEDEALIADLLKSEKEQAENLMIVDLMRNDLSRVGVLGTVAAENLLEVHTLPHVHQLVSTVSAQLQPGLSAVEALEALFPAGSMTGAPKIAAVRILNELEQGPRGIYSGAFGWFGYDGSCELAMVIRSIVIDDERALIGTGGGITIDSDPRAELDEMKLKAAPALRALGLA
jgi:para-aminobenzoate synthetase component 1